MSLTEVIQLSHAVRVAGLVTTMISVTGGGSQPGEGGRGGEDHRRICNYIRRMERDGVQRVKMFMVITSAYVIFWGPLFLVTLLQPGRDASALSYEVSKIDTALNSGQHKCLSIKYDVDVSEFHS